MEHFSKKTHGSKVDALEAARAELAESGGVLLDIGDGMYAVMDFDCAVDVRYGMFHSRYLEAAYWCELARAGFDETRMARGKSKSPVSDLVDACRLAKRFIETGGLGGDPSLDVLGSDKDAILAGLEMAIERAAGEGL